MKKIINKKHNKNEPWFKWLTRELNSYEAFQDLESGKNPRDVAEDFISRNISAISEVFEDFDEEGKDTLDQFLNCLLYTSPSPRDPKTSRMPSSA